MRYSHIPQPLKDSRCSWQMWRAVNRIFTPSDFGGLTVAAILASLRFRTSTIRQRENRDPRRTAVSLLCYRVFHPTRDGDILDAADLVCDDAAADRVPEILFQEDLSVSGVKREKVSLRVACE